MKKLLLSFALLPLLALAQTTLPTFWNFSVPGISTPPAGWITGLGTNGNLTYSGAANSVGGDNIACRLDATGEYLTIWFAEKPGDISFWAKGTAISPNPPFTGVFDVQESVDGSSWTTMRSFTTASPLTGTMTRFVNTPASTSRYVRFSYTTKESGSNVALDSVVINAAPLPSALLSVKQSNTTLINGNTFVSGNAASTKFILQNTGTATDIKIDSIVLSGANASDFSIGAFDSTITFGGGMDSFNVSFSAGSPGSRFGTVTVYTTDTENSPFLINLYAIGGTLATEPATQVPSLTISNIRTHAINVSFSRATGAEHYLVLRKVGGPVNETPVDGTTYMRGDYIGGNQVAYIGDDTAQFTPNYILAKTDYAYTAFAFNGPAGYENYKTTTPATSTATTPDGQPGTYYANINPSLPSFITDLNAKITQHDTIFYSNYAPALVNNYLARDTTGGKKVVTCVYSGEAYVYEDPFLWWTGTAGNPGVLTREHTFAQSWMPTNTGGSWPNVSGKEVAEYDDLHHLFPTNQLTANVKRSNYPFGVVVSATYTSPTGQGKLGTDANSKTVYEPHADQKGDLARALFYMLVRYNGINGVQWRLPSSQDINILLQWNQQDPPSPFEIARNQYISTIQKNRNPFIDHPEWVKYIDFSNMTYMADTGISATLSLLSPIGGETWTVSMPGAGGMVKWAAVGIDSVKIDVLIDDTVFSATPILLAANQDSASITILPIAPTTNKAKIKISSLDGTLSSISPNYFSIINSVGLANLINEKSLFIYPNPSKGLITIDIKDADNTNGTLFVTDIAGRLIMEKQIDRSSTIELTQQGVYFIKLQTDKGSIVKKVIIN